MPCQWLMVGISTPSSITGELKQRGIILKNAHWKKRQNKAKKQRRAGNGLKNLRIMSWENYIGVSFVLIYIGKNREICL